MKDIMETARIMTVPGREITPEGVMQAAQFAAMNAVTAAAEDGASARDCDAFVSTYTRVGQRLASMFASGGPYEGATSPELDER